MGTNIEFDFRLDEEVLELRGQNEALPFDKDVALGFIKGNNIGFLATKQETIIDAATGKLTGIYLAYRITAQAAEKCHFESVQCNVNLDKIRAVVKDMNPSEGKEGDPVKYTYKDTGSFNFKFAPLPIEATAGGEESMELNMYSTEIVAFGIDKKYARWEFRKPVNRELRLDRVLELLAQLPNENFADLSVDITVRFKLRADNIVGSIPFWGRKNILLDFTQVLL